MSEVIQNKFPSTAFVDAQGIYHHDEKNQFLAEQEQAGLTGAQPMGKREHFCSLQGYCAAHKILGCEHCSSSTPVLL